MPDKTAKLSALCQRSVSTALVLDEVLNADRCSHSFSVVMSSNSSTLSSAYHEFPTPIQPSGFDFHVYWISSAPAHAQHARQLHARISREFPELPLGRLVDRPIGPHPTSMFQVNTLTPHQTGALFSWLVVNRGPCDVLVHPNTGSAYKDHAELATWIGKPWPLYLDMLKNWAD